MNRVSIGSNNGLSPIRRQAITWTNAEMLLIGPYKNNLQWNFNQNSYIFIKKSIWKCRLENGGHFIFIGGYFNLMLPAYLDMDYDR